MQCYSSQFFWLDMSTALHLCLLPTSTNKGHTARFHLICCNSKQILLSLVCLSRAKRRVATLPNIFSTGSVLLNRRQFQLTKKHNGGFTQWHHRLKLNLSPVCHRHTYTHTYIQGTIEMSKCQRCMWIAAVITVKEGHSWDATLTLLTCLHQHTWTDSMAEQQFSHDASQNKMRCSHTPQWLKLLCDAQCLFVSTKGKKMLLSSNQKTLESRWKPLFPTDFTH